MDREKILTKAWRLAAEVFLRRAGEILRAECNNFIEGKQMAVTHLYPPTDVQVEACLLALADLYDAGVHDAWLIANSANCASTGKTQKVIEEMQGEIRKLKAPRPE